VCSPHGGLPEVAGETALYADPDQPEMVGAAIMELATDVGRRAALAAAGRVRSEGFGAPAAAARLLELRAAILAE
ncbi:MAG TPA: hypothetical protein VE650_16620, partial [Acetobacteraceae bacterium]|nr:hypothetical protein [Acetobacteraceae bacterium]